MSRQLPRKQNAKQKLIIETVKDFYGEGVPNSERKDQKLISLWLMNRRKGIQLSEEQGLSLELIKANLSDKIYVSGLERELVGITPTTP
jgi:hypothetical protein